MNLLLRGRRALLPDGGADPGWVLVDGARVTAAGRGPEPDGVAACGAAAEGAAVVETDVLAPGFVDLHCHGGGGSAYTDADLEAAVRAAGVHTRHGTTTTLASLVTAPLDVLDRQVRALRELVADDVVLGVHLEGPWLSPRFAGAHDPRLLRAPEAEDVERLLDAGGGDVRMATVAPELPGGLDAVRSLSDRGVLAAVGHTDADGDLMRRAADHGARVVTHLFNAMRPVHHRSPGPVPVALADDRVLVELVVDGVHVHPDVVAMAARASRGGFALVTDAMAAAAADDGRYLLGDLDVEVTGGVARLAGNGSIAGSTLTMDAALRTAVRAGIPLASAVHAATAAPADALGATDRGRLAVGARADLVCLDDSLRVTGVMRAGAWVVSPP